jgi:hypothetical protein
MFHFQSSIEPVEHHETISKLLRDITAKLDHSSSSPGARSRYQAMMYLTSVPRCKNLRGQHKPPRQARPKHMYTACEAHVKKQAKSGKQSCYLAMLHLSHPCSGRQAPSSTANRSCRNLRGECQTLAAIEEKCSPQAQRSSCINRSSYGCS